MPWKSTVADEPPPEAPPVEAPPVEVPPPEAPPVEIPPGCRLIRGRVIQRVRGDITRWYETTKDPDRVIEVKGRCGAEVRTAKGRERVLWMAEDNPAGEVAKLERELQGWRFNPSGPSPLHDEMDRAIAAGFEAWAAELAARSKLRPRPEFAGGALLGRCFISRGARRVVGLGDAEVRALLTRHLAGDHGELGSSEGLVLTNDQLWCPPIYGPCVVNAAAFLAGHGLVTSIYRDVYNGRDESVRVVTHINTTTIIWCPRLDGMGE